MKKMKLMVCIVASTIIIFSMISCKESRRFGIFNVLEDRIEMNGEIDAKTLKDFEALEKAYPHIKTIHIVNCKGSLDDTANIKLSKKNHDKKIDIHG